MSKLILSAFLLFAASARSAQVDRVIVRQQWPWHDGIQVEYALSGVTEPVDIQIAVTCDGTPVAVPPQAVVGDVFGVEDAVGSFTIDPKALLGSDRAKVGSLRVELSLAASSANVNEVLYKVFDLRTGACEDVTRRQILNGQMGSYETDYAKIGAGFTTPLDDVLVWTAVTNDVKYKTTHLVMRKIPAAGKTWCAGDQDERWFSRAELEPKVWVRLTYDYYMAVFETTQAQYRLMRGGDLPSACAYRDEEGLNPVNGVPYYEILGHPTSDESFYLGVVTGEKVCFPTNSYLRDVGNNSLCQKLWAKTASAGKCHEFALPTGAEWEFACRAGSSRTLYSGKEVSEPAACELAWIGASNSGNALREVGTRKPNAYGLYDMLGNALEQTCFFGDMDRGESGSGTEGDPTVNPVGKTIACTGKSGAYAMAGGGSAVDSGHPVYEGQWTDARPTARRYICEWYSNRTYNGFRLVMPARADGQWADHPAK